MDQKIPFAAKYFSVKEFAENDTTQLYVVVPNGAAIVPVTADGHIVLIRELRANTGKMEWYLPAGRKQESDADMQACAIREMREETGLAPRHVQHMFTTSSKSKWYKQDKSFYVGWDVYDAPLDTGDEVKRPEVHYMTPAAVLSLLRNRAIDDDMGDALYHFLERYAFSHVTFAENVYDVLNARYAAPENGAVSHPQAKPE